MGLNLWSLSREKRDKIDSRLEILGERKSSAITPHLEGVTISPNTICICKHFTTLKSFKSPTGAIGEEDPKRPDYVVAADENITGDTSSTE